MFLIAMIKDVNKVTILNGCRQAWSGYVGYWGHWIWQGAPWTGVKW